MTNASSQPEAPSRSTTSSTESVIGIERLSLDFTREATSAEAALVGALSDVKRAVPSAKLIETIFAAHS